jgi:hypothetical protein
MCYYCSNLKDSCLHSSHLGPLCAGTLDFRPACQGCINNALKNGGCEFDVRHFSSVGKSTLNRAVPHKYSWESRNEHDYVLLRYGGLRGFGGFG